MLRAPNPFGWSDEYYAEQLALLGDVYAYDIEVLPNIFTIAIIRVQTGEAWVYEISEWKNEISQILQFFDFFAANQIEMVGYNNVGYDYPIIHMIWKMREAITYQMIYEKNSHMIEFGKSGKGFSPHTIWPSDRFAPQIDVYLIHHFDNKAKRQSLKGVEFNMRARNVNEGAVEFGTYLTREQVDRDLIPYNLDDTRETANFALVSAEAIQFRRDLVKQGLVAGDVLNFNETKVGKQLMIQRLGDALCYDRSSGRKRARQTPRTHIALKDIIFPYIYFEHPEFQRVHQWMLAQTLAPSDLNEDKVSTKGVFAGIHATVNGFQFDYGTGGIHGSVTNRRYQSDDDFVIEDIDVTGLYPSISNVNRLAPAHLDGPFQIEYANLPIERAKYKKGTTGNALFKLGGNGTYGDTNNEFSPLYDPQYTMTITINGQLMLSMLAERLMRVPTLEMIQINTDGMTYRVHRTMLDWAHRIQAEWEAYTRLNLERVTYDRMWIRDVNNYVGEYPGGKLKLKGDYWYPDGAQFAGGWTEAISKAGPSAWHKDLGAQVVQRAAVAAMVHGVKPEHFFAAHRDPFDYMLRAKVDKSSFLFIGDKQVQRLTRYYVAKDGAPLRKESPPTGPIGQYKKARGVSDAQYEAWHTQNGNVWNPDIHQKNKAVHEDRTMSMQSGWLVAECNIATDFRFDNLNLAWYLEQARKLIVG